MGRLCGERRELLGGNVHSKEAETANHSVSLPHTAGSSDKEGRPPTKKPPRGKPGRPRLCLVTSGRSTDPLSGCHRDLKKKRATGVALVCSYRSKHVGRSDGPTRACHRRGGAVNHSTGSPNSAASASTHCRASSDEAQSCIAGTRLVAAPPTNAATNSSSLCGSTQASNLLRCGIVLPSR